MKLRVSPLFPALAALVLVFSCGNRGRVIPADKFADIYADMFLADQWLKNNFQQKKIADTTLFYEPIFNEYGYTLVDYDASVKYYLKKPAKYSKILKKASKKLSSRATYLEKVDKMWGERYIPPKYEPKDFTFDTLSYTRLWKEKNDTI